MDKTKEEEDKYFSDVIGLGPIKRKLSFFLSAYEKNGIFPNTMFVASKGSGKSFLCEKLLYNLQKPYVPPINCGLVTFREFWNTVVLPYCANDQKITIFLDEIGEISHKFAVALLTILNPTNDNITTYTYDNQTVTFDSRNITFLAATTCKNKVLPALIDRWEICSIPPYPVKDLGQIISDALGRMSDYSKFIDKDILNRVASCVRQNPRQAISLTKKINQYLVDKGETWLTLDGFEDLKYKTGILNLGLTHVEYEILKMLEDGPKTLTHISAKLGSTRAATQENELMLLNYGLISITATGRELTKKGFAYLMNKQISLD